MSELHSVPRNEKASFSRDGRGQYRCPSFSVIPAARHVFVVPKSTEREYAENGIGWRAAVRELRNDVDHMYGSYTKGSGLASWVAAAAQTKPSWRLRNELITAPVFPSLQPCYTSAPSSRTPFDSNEPFELLHDVLQRHLVKMALHDN